MQNLLCHFYYHVYFILSHKSENVLQKETKDLDFEMHLLTGEPNYILIPADWVTENDVHQILCLVLEPFCQT